MVQYLWSDSNFTIVIAKNGSLSRPKYSRMVKGILLKIN